LLPAQGDQLADTQAVPVGDEDQRRVPVPVAAEAPGGGHERVDLGRRQVLPGAALAVRDPARRGAWNGSGFPF